MKRLIAITVILLVIAALVAGFGYAPVRIPAGGVGVLFSKTSGWDDAPIVAGVWDWRWELLIPTNATIYEFTPETRTVSVESETLLPSAALYSRFLEGTPSLAQRAEVTVRYRVTPEGFVALAPRGFSDEGIAGWLSDADARIEMRVLRYVERRVREMMDDTGITPDPGALGTDLFDELARVFPEIEILTVTVHRLELPDLTLYEIGREAYRVVQASRETALIEAAAREATQESQRDVRISELERYGRVLTEYPVLLEYLEIAARNGSDPLSLGNLPELDALTTQ
jgi:hypothetical protein